MRVCLMKRNENPLDGSPEFYLLKLSGSAPDIAKVAELLCHGHPARVLQKARRHTGRMQSAKRFLPANRQHQGPPATRGTTWSM